MKTHIMIEMMERLVFFRASVEIQIQKRLYSVELLTAIDLNGRELFYDILNMDLLNENEPLPTQAEKYSFNGRLASDSFEKSISHPDPTVKNQFSFSPPKKKNRQCTCRGGRF